MAASRARKSYSDKFIFYYSFLSSLLNLVPTIQLSGFGFAFWVAMTRITDNQHHPGDVIAGSLLGIFIQVLLLNSKRLLI